jgi:autotransporter-associated beta strand protein
MKTNTSLTRIIPALVIGAFVALGSIAAAQTMTWTNTQGGSWTNALNWSDKVIANGIGATADFSELTLSGDTTVTLDSSPTVGNLFFGDLGDAYDWEVDSGSGGTLALAAPNKASITVSDRQATITASIAGTNGLVKTGPGTLVLYGTNTYSGGTTISNGTLETVDFATVGTGPINITADGTYELFTDDYNQPRLTNDVAGSGAFVAQGSGGNQSFWSGDWSGFSGTLTINSGNTSWWADSANTGSTAMRVYLAGGPPSSGSVLGLYPFLNSATRTYNMGELSGQAGAIIWGQPSSHNNITLSIGALGTSTSYAGEIINSYSSPVDASVTLNLTKVGVGTFTLSGTNQYTGMTIVSNGTLEVDGLLGTTPVTLQSGATLDGTGVIAGFVTVNSGGTLAAGNSSGLGTLTVGQGILLNSGSTIALRINKGAGTNDMLISSNNITYGGTLTVTNLGGTLSYGDSFTLFEAGSYSGKFAATNLPALGPGLAWDWNPNAGTLTVGFPLPVLSSIVTKTGTSFSLTCIGQYRQGYKVLMTTNLALPRAQWTQLASGVFGSIPVVFIDTNATSRQQFYCIQSP